MMHALSDYLINAIIFLLNYTAPVGLTVERDIPYASDRFHRADIYRLENASARPVIVYLYGGGWRGGSKGRAAFVGGALARRGFVVVIPEYRHFPQVGLSEILADHAAAVGWTLTHAGEIGGDPRRVIIAGSSSGAWGAAMLVLDPRWLERAGSKPDELAGMVGLAGPYMTSSLTEQSDRDVFKESGSDMEPINHASTPHPPMLLLTGTADTDVLPISTTMLSEKLRGGMGAIESRSYAGLGHADIVLSLVFPFSRQAPVLKDIEHFSGTLPQR